MQTSNPTSLTQNFLQLENYLLQLTNTEKIIIYENGYDFILLNICYHQ